MVSLSLDANVVLILACVAVVAVLSSPVATDTVLSGSEVDFSVAFFGCTVDIVVLVLVVVVVDADVDGVSVVTK